MKNSVRSEYEDVLNILEDERRLIIDHQLGDLEVLLQNKTDAFVRLEGKKKLLSESEISEIENALKRNQALYQACMDGMRAGLDRIKEVKDVISSLQTYSSTGTRNQESMSKGRVSLKF